MMALNTENQPVSQSEVAKSPQEELEELLRQAKAGGVKTRQPAAAGPSKMFKVANPLKGVGAKVSLNPTALVLAALAIVLMAGTAYFVISNLRGSTGTVTFETNESQIGLLVDGKIQGLVDSGSVLRLKVGEYKLTFNKEGFLGQDQTVTVVADQATSVLVNLLPVPVVSQVVAGETRYARLNRDGTEVSYYDASEQVFRTVTVQARLVADLFRGSFPSLFDVTWSPASQIAIVQLSGQYSLPNMVDHRNLPGGYIPLGERPNQGPAKNNGVATWFFDDSRKLAEAGWQPILLNESIRQVAYSADGAYIVYIYDTADGERSLVRAFPDGSEWRRMVTELPNFVNPKLIWGSDDRYLLIEDQGKLLIADLISQSLLDPLADRTLGSRFALSNEGDQLAYRAGERLKIYNFLDGAISEVPEMTLGDSTVFAWLDSSHVVFAMENQTFEKVDVLTGQKLIIPFVGAESLTNITKMEYSRVGQILMLTTPGGIYVMQI